MTSNADDKFLFGIDLDGTLLAPRGELRARTRDAVHAVLAAGHKVAFATGRNFVEARMVFDAMGHHELAVLVSGAIVCDTKTGKWLHHWPMSPTLAAELCGVIESVGVAAVAMCDRIETGIDYLISHGREVNESLMKWIGLTGQVVERRLDLSRQDHSHTLRVSTVTDFKSAAEIRSVVNQRFGKRAYLHGIIVPEDAVEILEMFDPHVNKWHGLKNVADRYGIAHDNIICIGDDTNDLPMIRQAKLGVAMGNGRAELKEIANLVIGRNTDDGLAEFLEQWLRDPRSFDAQIKQP